VSSFIRFLLIALGIIALIVVGYIILRRPKLPGTAPLPVDPGQLMPSTWQPRTDQVVECDFDQDPANDVDWLVPYNYDPAAGKTGGPIGGVIFVRQVNRVPQSPSTPSPYRPASVVPYKLLPDIYEGKGQGYLGDTGISFQFWPTATSGPNCKTQEIAVWGSGAASRLSIFRWNAQENRFSGSSYVADNLYQEKPDATQPITKFTTSNRFNDRSQLCNFNYYSRPGSSAPGKAPPTLSFAEVPDSNTIDFCSGAPADPAYPEGVVVALLRHSDLPGNDSPTGNSYFLNQNITLPPDLSGLTNLKRATYRILALRNQGSLAPYPAAGTPLNPPPPDRNSNDRDQWWQGTDQATVQTTIVVDGREHSFLWTLVSIANGRVATDTRWRITKVTEVIEE
jgi:hypothetical protein